ncbi:MAG: HAMP domain-containing histidine kinase, partial [Eubacteriales bacterium]|nr:HAMP domain-containing histidine kinase [Eubacteriales bacterium]
LVKLDYKEAGLVIEETNLNYMLEDIIKMVGPLAEQKNIEITTEFLKNVVVDADEMKLSLAISNLVENAIKYTCPEGSVKVILDSDHQNAFITVQDTGIGISEEEQGKIFNRFYRVDKTRDRETGGTGLGLSITHSAVLLHKGSIKVSSKEGKGSTFVVRIPIKNIEKSIN